MVLCRIQVDVIKRNIDESTVQGVKYGLLCKNYSTSNSIFLFKLLTVVDTLSKFCQFHIKSITLTLFLVLLYSLPSDLSQ